MFKKIVFFFSMMVFCTCLCFSISVSAAGETLYENNFEKGDTGLENVEGTAEIVEEKGNHILKLTHNTDGYFHGVLKSPDASDFDLSMRVRVDRYESEWNWAKLYFRSPSHSENAAYHMQLWSNRVCFAAKDPDNGLDEMKPIVENANFPIRVKNWYTIEIFARGDTMTAYINGRESLKMTDEGFTSGVFGFSAWGCNYSVDDLKIVTRSSEDPIQTTFTKQTTSSSSFASQTSLSPDSSDVSSSIATDVVSSKQDADSTNIDPNMQVSDASANKGENSSAIITILGIVGIVVVMAVGTCAIVYIIKNLPPKEQGQEENNS